MALPTLDNGSVAAIVGAISGGLASWVMTLFSRRADKHDRVLEAVGQLLEDLQAESVEYWRYEGQDRDKERKIKSLLERLDMRVQDAQKHGVSGLRTQRSTQLLDDLTDETTGGGFETLKRRRDMRRVARIRELCAAIRNELH